MTLNELHRFIDRGQVIRAIGPASLDQDCDDHRIDMIITNVLEQIVVGKLHPYYALTSADRLTLTVVRGGETLKTVVMERCGTCRHWDDPICNRAGEHGSPMMAEPIGYENSRLITEADFGCAEHVAKADR